MGLDRTVNFASGQPPAYQRVSELLQRCGFPVQLRMIDGQLAFPDEMPPESWRELRLGTPQGMVTVRREKDRIVCVTWGNADRSLLQAWNAVVWAFAAAGEGNVLDTEGAMPASVYQRQADLPASLSIPGMEQQQ
jgi:hypothetical protein